MFVHTPNNVDAPALARRLHADVRATVPELDPLPEPVAATQVAEPTLFPAETNDTVAVPEGGTPR